jgi:hypothetical protein
MEFAWRGFKGALLVLSYGLQTQKYPRWLLHWLLNFDEQRRALVKNLCRVFELKNAAKSTLMRFPALPLKILFITESYA